MVVDLVHDHEPVPGRRFGVRSVGPELGQYPGVVPSWHDLGRVGLARGGIELVAGARIAAFGGVVERRVVLETRRILGDIAEACRGDVHRHAVGRIEVRRPDRH